MSAPGPRRLVWRGAVEARGYLLDASHCGEAELRRRVLARWGDGARLLRAGRWRILLLAAPERVRAERSPGTPLVASGGALWAAPLGADERAALQAPPGAVVVPDGGGVAALGLGDQREEDPSRWLDLSGFSVQHLEPLSAPPAPASEGLGAPPVDADAALEAAVGEAPAERAALLEALARRGRGGGSAQAPPPGPQSAGESPGAAGSTGGAGAAQGGSAPSVAGWWQRSLDRLWAALNPGRFSGLARWLGRRQAEYLRDLLDRFERGDLEEALRRAVPLGGEAASGRPALGPPTPRESLRLEPNPPSGAGGAIGLEADLYQHLRALYRRAFEKLEREGRVQEAAFVLLQLLGEVEEAVAWLEGRGELALAASIAEGRGLAPERVVRLWWLAGERERAMTIARRTGAFAGAVARLEAAHPLEAAALRQAWSQQLALAGDYLRAVEVLGLDSATWQLLGPALEAGGAAGEILAGRALRARPDLFERLAPRVMDRLREADPDDLRLRLALCEGLADGGDSAPLPDRVRPLYRLATRALARDLATDESPDPLERDRAQRLRTLARLSRSPALLTDLRGLPAPERGPRPTPWSITVDAPVGRATIHDAVSLSNRRLLVACGDAGLWLLAPGGRRLRHLDIPAHRLVVSRSGNRVITMARRGSVWQLHKLAVDSWSQRPWRDVKLSAFADRYDGGRWFVVEGDALTAVDALDSGWRSLWRVSGLGAIPGAPGRPRVLVDDGTLGLLIEEPVSVTGPERPLTLWSYQLPELVLRRREPVSWGEEPLLAMAVHAGAAVCVSGATGAPETVVVHRTPGGRHTLALPEGDRGYRGLALSASGFCAHRLERTIVITEVGGRVLARLGFQASALRWQGALLIGWNQRGQGLVVDARRLRIDGIYAA